MTNTVLLDAMKRTAAGLSIIPIKPDGTKAPAIPSWKQYQDRIAASAELFEWFENGDFGFQECGGPGT